MQESNLIRNIILVLASLGASSASFSENKNFNTTQVQTTVIESLDFKSVFRELYANEMFNAYVTDEIKLSHVGLKDGEKSYMASFHPISLYKNNAGEKRYLVMVEKQEISNDKLVTCHACRALTDLFIFKALNNGKFLLVSRTSVKNNIQGSWGKSDLDLKNYSSNIQSIGSTTMGFFYKSEYMGQGIENQYLQVLALREDKPIETYDIDQIGEDTKAHFESESPMAYSYNATYLFIKKNLAELYPIKIRFNGEHDTGKRVEKYNVIKTYAFNVDKRKYEPVKTEAY